MVTTTETGGAATTGGRCWWCSKDDFFPEESFKSWGTYLEALRESKTRLKDRLLARSLDDTELNQIRSRSHHSMKKTLTGWDILWFGVGSVMGAGIFVLTGLTSRTQAGPAVVLSFLASGISALLSVLCYTEFAVEIPVAGGSFAYLRVELGDFVAFIAAGNILFEYIVSGASVARSWTSYFATLCNHSPNDFRINVSALGEDYNHLDPIAVLISIIIGIAAILSTKGSSRFNIIASISHIAVLLFIAIVGLIKANPSNFSNNFAPFGVRGIFRASAVLFFAFVGFDGVATMAEETKNPRRDIPFGLIASMGIIIFIYCLLAGTLCLMQPFTMIDVDAPYTVAFQAVGLNWVKYIVALGALEGMTTVLLANIIGQARYFTHIGRTHMVPPWLASINEKTGTPMNATIVMTIANCIVALFTDLEVLANLLSISTLFIFALVAVALLVRRYYVTGETTKTDRNMLIGFLGLIIGSSVATAVYWMVSDKEWIGYVVTFPVWFLATLGLKLKVKEAKSPKLWGVPWFPWLPSLSIAVNVFLLGSIDAPSYVRFGIWSLVLLTYYFFVGLHASYDAAKEINSEGNGSEMRNCETGNVAPVA
ncbi:cationic amino acid transporter 1-like [Macadamia integrifolia]|uniref:cationic amino acid transporter 1-like n=1 Tax=Macadamia integrifolia TaxID=60698 RepID=UPI001C4E7678|nr:cationic amino acid transporter 1-like [Macadamia integrifolia]